MGSSNGAVALGFMLVAIVLLVMAAGVMIALVLAVSYLATAIWGKAKRHAAKLIAILAAVLILTGGVALYYGSSSPESYLAAPFFWVGLGAGMVGTLLMLSYLAPPTKTATGRPPWRRLRVDATFWLIVHRAPIALIIGSATILGVVGVGFPAQRGLCVGGGTLLVGILVGIHRDLLISGAKTLLRAPKLLSRVPARLQDKRKLPVPAVIEALERSAQCEYACIYGYVEGDPKRRCTSNKCLWADLVRSSDSPLGD